MTSRLTTLPGRTFKHKCCIAELMERGPRGVMACTTHPWKAQDLSFPTSPLAANLEVVWPLNQKPNRNRALPSQIQHTRFWTPIWATKSCPIAAILWGMKLHLTVKTTKAQTVGADPRLMLEPAVQEEDYEKTKRGQSASIIGGPPWGPTQGFLDKPRSLPSAATAKEKAQALKSPATASPGYTLKPWPGFVSRIATDSDGVSACSSHAHLA